MKFFLDTANLDEIREAAALGLCDGVTTNPTLVSKEGNVDFKQHIAEICKIVSGPVLGAHPARRVVDHPVVDELDAFALEYVGRIEALAVARPEPPARALAAEPP